MKQLGVKWFAPGRPGGSLGLRNPFFHSVTRGANLRGFDAMKRWLSKLLLQTLTLPAASQLYVSVCIYRVCVCVCETECLCLCG